MNRWLLKGRRRWHFAQLSAGIIDKLKGEVQSTPGSVMGLAARESARCPDRGKDRDEQLLHRQENICIIMGNLKSKDTHDRAILANGKVPVKSLNMIFPKKVLPLAQDYSVSTR